LPTDLNVLLSTAAKEIQKSLVRIPDLSCQVCFSGCFLLA
jgi:hypothetical protein